VVGGGEGRRGGGGEGEGGGGEERGETEVAGGATVATGERGIRKREGRKRGRW